MTFWMIVSWVFVVLLTAANVAFFVFVKKKMLDPMAKMAFPGSKSFLDAARQAQSMMGGMKGRGGPPPGFGGMGGMNPNDPRLKQAMEMLKQLQKR